MTRSTDRFRTAQMVWMLYYNKTLYEQGIISEKEFNRMRLNIQNRYEPRGKNKV